MSGNDELSNKSFACIASLGLLSTINSSVLEGSLGLCAEVVGSVRPLLIPVDAFQLFELLRLVLFALLLHLNVLDCFFGVLEDVLKILDQIVLRGYVVLTKLNCFLNRLLFTL